MNRLDYYATVGIVSCALVAGFVIHAKVSSHAANEATVAAVQQQTQAVVKKADDTIKAAQDSQAKQLASAARATQVIEVQKAAPVEPVDYGKIDAMIAAHVDAPVKTETDVATSTAITTTDTKALRDFTLSCDQKEISLNSCKLTTDNLTAELNAEKDKTEALKKQVSADKVLIDGGTFWGRFRRGLKHAACGAGAAGAGVLAAKSQSTGTSAGVAGGTFALCEALASR